MRRLFSWENRGSSGELNEETVYDYSSSDKGLTVTETKTEYYPDDPPETEVNTFVYNAKGQLTKGTEYGDLITTYAYDKQGRLKKTKDLWNGATQTYTYNKKGLLAKRVTAPYMPDNVIYAKCVVTYTYDAKLRNTKSTEVYGPYKNVTVKTYKGEQDIPVKTTSTNYRKNGKKYKKTYKDSFTYEVQAL